MKSLSKLPILVVAIVMALSSAQAATFYNFDITYNGTSTSVDGTSDPVAGTNLLVGDHFTLDIHAATTGYWSVNTSFNTSIFASFALTTNATRTGNVTTTLFLDGSQILQDVDLNLSQSAIHMGSQGLFLPTGTLFDQVIVDYTFVSISGGVNSIIQNNPLQPAFNQLYNDSRINYVQGAQGVPDTGATLALLGFALSGLVGLRLRFAKLVRA
jgi:hypothetical protein